ncbi:MAG TPA: hypothetical protein VLV18_05565 [Terriglobales bacterium]|nr:hypothetical protein [Terriglobales bacterium]
MNSSYGRMMKWADGAERVRHIRGEMKRRIWVKNGDVVLVALWDYRTSRVTKT